MSFTATHKSKQTRRSCELCRRRKARFQYKAPTGATHSAPRAASLPATVVGPSSWKRSRQPVHTVPLSSLSARTARSPIAG